MTRQNLCPNPACGANITGWTGSAAPTQATGLTGFPVTTGANYSAGGTFVQSPAAPSGMVAAGGTYTLSMYVRNSNGLAANGKTLYLAWKRSAGGDDFGTTTTVNLPANSVTRVSITGVAPALANGAYLVLDGLSAATGVGDYATAALYEAAAGPAGTYFDGNSASASWDGTANNSTSTLNDAGPATVNLAPASLALAAVPLPAAPGPVSVALAPAVMAVAAVPVVPIGPTTVALTPAVLTLSAVPLRTGRVRPGRLTPGVVRPSLVVTAGP